MTRQSVTTAIAPHRKSGAALENTNTRPNKAIKPGTHVANRTGRQLAFNQTSRSGDPSLAGREGSLGEGALEEGCVLGDSDMLPQVAGTRSWGTTVVNDGGK